MAGEEIYLARMGAWLARALGEVGGFASDLDTEGLGFQLPQAIVEDSGVTAAGAALADAGSQLIEAAEEIEPAVAAGDNGALVRALLHLVEGVYRLADGMARMAEAIDARAATLPGSERTEVEAFAALIARTTIDYLVVSLLERELPRTAYLLRLIGLIEWKRIDASGPEDSLEFVRKSLRLERIKDLVTDPAAHFTNVYGWGTADFDPGELMKAVCAFQGEEAAIEVGRDGADAFMRMGAFDLRRDGAPPGLPGLKLDYSARIERQFETRVPVSDDWGVAFKAALALAGGVIVRLKPPFDLLLEPKTGTASGDFLVKADRNEAARGFTIVGGNDLIELTADNFALGAELIIGASTTGAVSVDPGIFAELKGLTLKLGSEGSDNFLASLLASADISGQFDIALGWRLSEGLKVRAAGGLEIAIPMHQSLGIATLETLYLILKIRDDASFALEASAAITGNLGPLSASVERIGVEVVLAFVEGAEANLGPIDLSLRFKPPNGVGLALDAGMVRGGGYLYLDYEKGEYAGAMELVVAEFLAVKAIGLINTRMPDGSDGFSLLIVVTAEFGTPIQLGFGFTLVGLGGLLGLNRTMMLEELAEGVRSGAVESVMFPQNVVANAPRIISDMKRFFPPENGRFLIGPMAKLGWGTPSLITASLGIVIEIPPGNIAIMGVIKCVLPHEEAALLVLQVKFIGALEVDKKRLWFFASMYGSRVLFISIGGEMGLLIAWGDDSNFVLSVGGFHPRFNPPPMPFPVPRRVALSILDTSFARIRVEGYFAVTSNTAQFGAAVELYFGVSVFSLEGHIGFDALFQFSPFYFLITFGASVEVKVFGAGIFSVRVRGELEGPTPWHVEGEGSISILFWDIDIPFSHTWGDGADTVLPSIDALPVLKAELEKRENWLALPPSGAPISVSLRTIDATAELVLHPVGALRVSQRALPINLDIQKIGNKQIADITRASIAVSAAGLAERAKVKEQFAVAQYRDVDGAAKLSAPGYEPFDGGADISVAGSDVRTSHAVKRVMLHELIVIDNNYKEHAQRFFNAALDWFRLLLGSNATARSPLSAANRAQQQPFDDRIRTEAPGFIIASAIDNGVWGGAQAFASQAEALDALAEAGRADPKAANDLHVIPAVERKVAA